jgi:DNA polymerase-3 subunit epsilon
MDQYAWFDQVPDHLKTKTQLGKLGLKPGGEPVAFIYWRRRDATYYLYDVAEAVPKRTLSTAQQAALAKAQQAAERKRQTCAHCGAVDPETDHTMLWYPDDRGADRYRKGPRWCPTCQNLHVTIEHVGEEAGFAADRAQAVIKAQNLLKKDPATWCVLDTETTGLDPYAQVVQVAVLAPDGAVLLDTLVRPTCPVTEGARAVHHIPDEALRTAPSFWDIYPALVRSVQGKRVVVYNAGFDEDVLVYCCALYDLPVLPVRRWWCAMHWYAPYAGEWSEYHGDYKWPRLGGDHTALGDCQATLRLLQRVAADQGAIVEMQRLNAEAKRLQREWEKRKAGEAVV